MEWRDLAQQQALVSCLVESLCRKNVWAFLKRTSKHVYLSYISTCPNLLWCGSQPHTQLYPDPRTPALRCETEHLWPDSASPEGLHWHLLELSPFVEPPPAWSPVYTHTHTHNIMNKPIYHLKFVISSLSSLNDFYVHTCFKRLVMKHKVPPHQLYISVYAKDRWLIHCHYVIVSYGNWMVLHHRTSQRSVWKAEKTIGLHAHFSIYDANIAVIFIALHAAIAFVLCVHSSVFLFCVFNVLHFSYTVV